MKQYVSKRKVRKDILSQPLRCDVPSIGDIVHPRGRGFRGEVRRNSQVYGIHVITYRGFEDQHERTSDRKVSR